MVKKKRGLGRGLDALLGQNKALDQAIAQPQQGFQLQHLSLDKIQPGPYQPRREIAVEGLQELADSIKAQGVIQPIVVKALNNIGNTAETDYEIIAGERRWRAAKMAELDEIPAVIRDISEQTALALALIENIQRESLNPIEEAIALQRLMEEFELTHQQIAEAIGRSRTTVTNLLRLLDLTDEVKQLLERGDLSTGHARALLTLSSEQQNTMAEQIIAKGLSVRQTEELLRTLQTVTKNSASSTRTTTVWSEELEQLQQHFNHKLGTTVKIQHQSNDKGRVIIHYQDLDKLKQLLALF